MSNYDAKPYCKAIFALALREQNFLEWQEILDELVKITCLTLPSRSQVREIQEHPDSAAICAENIMAKFPLAINLLNILLQNKKLDLLPDIAINFKKLVLEYQNIIEAKVVTVIALNALQKQQLKKALEERYQTQILLKYETDSALIGGVIVYVKDQVIDGSIKTALHCLKQSLE